MTGEALAVLAALAYGLAGVSITRSQPVARGDNGVFLSILMTSILSGAIWLGSGTVPLPQALSADARPALLIFVLAGLCANAVGRQSMYRATERIGAVATGLLRRLTPVFALPLAFVVLDQEVDLTAISGAAMVIAGALIYGRRPSCPTGPLPLAGLVLGLLSPLAYAMAYCLRGLGLAVLPDPALGTCVGALAGAAWVLLLSMRRRGCSAGWRFVTVDRTSRHWQTALSLSAGQMLQFFALNSANVATVAVLGTLEVVFAGLIILLVTKSETIDLKRLLITSTLAAAGTALLVAT
ncbi:MAG: EamA family transporter [Rhodobacteraceae bacterium]|nr:EamA family transporter [Paracoccaceae bacterium]